MRQARSTVVELSEQFKTRVHARFDARTFCRWRSRRDVLSGGSDAPVQAQQVVQADGLRQRQPESATEEEMRAAMLGIMRAPARLLATVSPFASARCAA